MSGKSWTTAEDRTIRAGLSAGLSYGRLAKKIGRTRCMVAGRISRLGLCKARKPRGPRNRPRVRLEEVAT